MIKVQALQDESSNWYLVPNELSDEFNRLLEKIYSDDYPHRYDDEEEFIEKFSKYRTGDINNIQLFIDEKKK